MFRRGTIVLELINPAWASWLEQGDWRSRIHRVSARASVEPLRIKLPIVSYRRELRDASFELAPDVAAKQARARRTGSNDRTRDDALAIRPLGDLHRGDSTMQGLLAADPGYRALEWLLRDAVPFFTERGRTARWKYLVEWVGHARTARLHHRLQRPQSAVADAFDLVTFDSGGKVLHVVERAARGTPEALEAFVERVVAAKTARIREGDIGAAIFIAPNIGEHTRARYARMTSRAESRSWVFGLQNSFNQYEAFIRIGTRRGFHLLLIEEHDRELVPLLPDLG